MAILVYIIYSIYYSTRPDFYIAFPYILIFINEIHIIYIYIPVKMAGYCLFAC